MPPSSRRSRRMTRVITRPCRPTCWLKVHQRSAIGSSSPARWDMAARWSITSPAIASRAASAARWGSRCGTELSPDHFRGSHPFHLVRVQRGQDIAAEAPDLLHEKLMRHGAEIDVEQHVIGAGMLAFLDEALDHLFGRAPGGAVDDALLGIGHG